MSHCIRVGSGLDVCHCVLVFVWAKRFVVCISRGGRNIALVSNDLVDTYLVITTRSFLEESDIYYYIFLFIILLIIIVDF